jgi:hypothetical protein
MITYIWKILVCALSVIVGNILGGLLSAALGLRSPQMPPAVDAQLLGVTMFAGSVVLCIGLAELARRLRGGFWTRWLILAWFAYACLGINNTIEASVFTSIGGTATMAVLWLVSCLLVAGVATRLFRGATPGEPRGASVRAFFAAFTPRQWACRLLAAWLAFPVIYFIFGMPVGLAVQDAYRGQAFGLRLPSLEVVLAVQLVRGLIFLLASLPILLAWSESRRRLSLTFGLGLFVILGLYGLIQACWLPWGLRGLHALEILLDSLVYGWVLVKLLMPRPEPQPTPVGEVAAVA